MVLTFPFWAVLPSSSGSSGGSSAGENLIKEYAPAFSTPGKMRAYLDSQQESVESQPRMIGRDTLMLFIADLHFYGLSGLRLDPDHVGKAGTEISLGELMKMT